ncbi:hypothetical protein EXIGLDRAFT_768537 [Exidia glandulosa HHB12029]|uniref:Uncharacterized protein n=1 Tax=Exidia glandulosa HHB12029 TaxID=1314781 RepID=A0A165I5B1_EXIGL|nr:hypothetical protein EXIGLDRAFT_768537 [Exidia glandulosa HHB12029]
MIRTSGACGLGGSPATSSTALMQNEARAARHTGDYEQAVVPVKTSFMQNEAWTASSRVRRLAVACVVLQFRVWIMFQKSRRVLWLNGALFVVNVLVTVVMFVLFLNGGAFEPAPPWIQGACYGVRDRTLVATLVTLGPDPYMLCPADAPHVGKNCYIASEGKPGYI